jgi:hypothetical protein
MLLHIYDIAITIILHTKRRLFMSSDLEVENCTDIAFKVVKDDQELRGECHFSN